MSATPLTAQECFLLERYTSLEYYARMRDAFEAAVRYAEGLLERYMHHLPDGYRKRHPSEQPDIGWGDTVLPNFRQSLQIMNDVYIRRTHDDWYNWNGNAVSGDVRGSSDFWHGWMNEVEPSAKDKYWSLLAIASRLASNINTTSQAGWLMRDLSVYYSSSDFGSLDPPPAWPRYRLNPDIRVKTDEPVTEPGLYWPEAEDSAVQFLIPTIEKMSWATAAPALVGLTEDGCQFDREEPTTWTKVERVPGETVEDGLANLLDSEPTPQSNVPGGKPCPRTGWWFTPAEKNGRRRYFKHGDTFPVIEGSSYGDTFWQWSPDQSDAHL